MITDRLAGGGDDDGRIARGSQRRRAGSLGGGDQDGYGGARGPIAVLPEVGTASSTWAPEIGVEPSAETFTMLTTSPAESPAAGKRPASSESPTTLRPSWVGEESVI